MVLYLGLSFSSRFNKIIFTEIINPYDPLKISNDKFAGNLAKNLEHWEDPDGLFPIFAYNIPENSKDFTASLKVIRKGGINIFINGNVGWIKDCYKLRDKFRELNDPTLRWIVNIENECHDDYIFKNSNDESNSNIKGLLATFNDDFVYGWYIWDEPGTNRKLCTPFNLGPNDDNADINRMTKQIRTDSILNKKLAYVNLFPTYWEQTPDNTSYEQYIDSFINSQEFKPRVLSIDHYPFIDNEYGGFREDYYLNLKIIRQKSLEYNIPFWMMVLSSGHDHYSDLSFEEISFQVYSALAYGAKGIGYYTYSLSWEKINYRSWILEKYVDEPDVADSLHGPLFLPVKKLNENLQNLGKILMKLKSVEVLHTSNFPNNQNGISSLIFNEQKPNVLIKNIKLANKENSDSKVLLGIFENNNSIKSSGKYLLIVNKDLKMETDITLAFNKNYNLYKFDKETGEKGFIKQGNKIVMGILPGSGELFYCE